VGKSVVVSLKGLDAKTNSLAVSRQLQSNFVFDFSFEFEVRIKTENENWRVFGSQGRTVRLKINCELL
jgi:hypothetical protein